MKGFSEDAIDEEGEAGIGVEPSVGCQGSGGEAKDLSITFRNLP